MKNKIVHCMGFRGSASGYLVDLVEVDYQLLAYCILRTTMSLCLSSLSRLLYTSSTLIDQFITDTLEKYNTRGSSCLSRFL